MFSISLSTSCFHILNYYAHFTLRYNISITEHNQLRCYLAKVNLAGVSQLFTVLSCDREVAGQFLVGAHAWAAGSIPGSDM